MMPTSVNSFPRETRFRACFSDQRLTPLIAGGEFCCRFALLALLALLAATEIARAQPPERSVKHILSAVVGLRAQVPEEARTAAVLGTERVGSGIVIDGQGLVLTIGYLTLEADRVVLALRPGESPEVAAQVLAYDHDTGFGLVRAMEPLEGVSPIPLGDSDIPAVGSAVIIASYGGEDAARPALLADRREFAGYWEYLLDDALLITPPHPLYGGAALIHPSGTLIGVGSLIVRDATADGQPLTSNLFVPINRLKPILGELLTSGRGPAPHRPWLGIYTEEMNGQLVVRRVAEDGPAHRAGVTPGSVIDTVGGQKVTTMADFYRKLWSLGGPGDPVPLTLLTLEGGVEQLSVTAGDRHRWLRIP